MEKLKKIFGLVVLCIIMLQSCSEKSESLLYCDAMGDIDTIISSENLYVDEIPPEYSNAIGIKLENPYSLDNMRRAMVELQNNGSLSKSSSNDQEFVRATHLYVKFMPQTLEQLNVLESDTTLDLYPYPLDYELVVSDTISDEQDELFMESSNDNIYPQYAAVKIEHQLPNVPYTILDSLFILYEGKDGEDAISKSYPGTKEKWTMLEDKSLELTGNEVTGCISKRRKSWRPAGYIFVSDDTLGKIGVEGMIVKARRWFTTHKGFVFADGHYQCNGTFKRKANYFIKFEQEDFKVKNHWVRCVKKDGPNRDYNWDHTFNGKSMVFYATVFRAAFQYYRRERYGLYCPPSCCIHAFDVTGSNGKNGNFSAGRKYCPFTNAIHVYYRSRTCAKIYGTTIHELTHAAHWDNSDGIANIKYCSISSSVKDSWAVGVQNFLTGKQYKKYERGGYTSQYTNIVTDLRNGTIEGKGTSPYKYSITEIQNSLRKVKTWNDWKENIKSLNKNGKAHIDSLFTVWANK